MIIGHSHCHSYEYVAVECGLMCKKKLRAVPIYISVNFTYNKWSLSLTVYCLDVTNIRWYIDQIVGSIPATGIYFWLKMR